MSFRSFILEDSDAEYNAAAKFHADMSKRELKLPKKAKPGDVIVFSHNKDWKSDMKKLDQGNVQARIVIMDKDHDLILSTHDGLYYQADQTELKMYDYGTIISVEDAVNSYKYGKKYQELYDAMKAKGKF